MKKFDLVPYYTTFRIAIYMAEERYKEYKADFDKKDTDGDGIVSFCVNDISDIEDLAYKGKKRELYDFLNSLDYEVVKALQVIMYIGRDSSCQEEDGTYSYEKSREHFDEYQGWDDDKSIEVAQMVEKVRLDEYLKNGFAKLGINL